MAVKSFSVGVSRLIEAIRAGNLEAVKSALADGADVEEADIHGSRGLPLRTACFAGNLDIIRELLTYGVDINLENADGPGAPLRLALRAGKKEVAAFLLANGAQIPAGIQVPDDLLPLKQGAAPESPIATAPETPAIVDVRSVDPTPESADNNIIEFTPSSISSNPDTARKVFSTPSDMPSMEFELADFDASTLTGGTATKQDQDKRFSA